MLQSDGSQALPHLSVPNISHVNWKALRQAGFEGCVFDKDNTLTEPYAIAVAPILVASFKSCIETFDGRVALLSNSAGLQEFDPEGGLAQGVHATAWHGVDCLRFCSGTADLCEYCTQGRRPPSWKSSWA